MEGARRVQVLLPNQISWKLILVDGFPQNKNGSER